MKQEECRGRCGMSFLHRIRNICGSHEFFWKHQFVSILGLIKRERRRKEENPKANPEAQDMIPKKITTTTILQRNPLPIMLAMIS